MSLEKGWAWLGWRKQVGFKNNFGLSLLGKLILNTFYPFETSRNLMILSSYFEPETAYYGPNRDPCTNCHDSGGMSVQLSHQAGDTVLK